MEAMRSMYQRKKEAEANKQAYERVGKAAQEHAIPEIIVEICKIKEQQTKVIQRMLIKIHKEIKKQYLFQKIETLQQEANEQHEDYEPWAEADETNQK